ncbi:MAG: hypothetical protein JNL30_18580 [Rubrivivax sp.]|nr:hypothetical protein [Rubrivivax sp.]
MTEHATPELGGAAAHGSIEGQMNHPRHPAARRAGTGRAGDFNFLAGRWSIKNRRLKTRWSGTGDWEEFDGEATCFTVLGGLGSIEELCIPPGQPRGLGIRLLDTGTGLWSDYWSSSGSGVVMPPPMTGVFEGGVGTFVATDDRDGDIPIHSRGVWDRITPTGCRWHQAFSRDGGRTWEDNWFMDWTRIG